MTKIVQLPIFTKHQTPHIKKERELKNRFIYKKREGRFAISYVSGAKN
jgi:hypothetical protein